MTRTSLLTRTIAITVFGIVLGCSGLMGYGAELADASVVSAQPFDLRFVPTREGPHHLWLTYEVNHAGSADVRGAIEVAGASEPASWPIDLFSFNSPTGKGGSYFLNKREVSVPSVGGRLSSMRSETVFVATLPQAIPGQEIAVRGTLTAGPGTAIVSARLVVTE